MFILMPLLKVMQFLQAASYGVLTISYHAGRSILLVLAKIWSFLCDICAVLAIIGEEFHNFLCELDTTISAIVNYMQSSTNGGLNAGLEAFKLFWSHMVHFAVNTKLYSRLLATGTGQCLCDGVSLLYAGLILLADCSWWLITCIPRAIFYLLIWLMDCFVFSLHNLTKAVVLTVNVVINDIFKLTILVVVIFAIFKMRRLLYVLMLQFIWRVRIVWDGVVRRFYRRPQLNEGRLPEMANVIHPRNPLTVWRLLPQWKKPARHPSQPVPDELRCVVCQDSPKCVVMLPCKHMCVCEECNVQLLRQNIYSCPLCRSVVTYFLPVYT